MGRKKKLPDGMVQRPGRKGYYADFRINGRRVQKKLGTDFEAAKSILNELKARAERAEFGLLDNDYPIADLRDAYLKRCEQELAEGSTDRYRRGLDDVIGFLGLAKVRQIEPGAVLAYREDRLRLKGPATINHDVGVLQSMLGWGVRRKLIGSNPLAGLEPLRHDRPKQGRALTDEEVRRLLDASPERWRDVWYALLVTGMRKGELAGLRFTDIDWEARELIVRMHNAKGKRERRVPIDDELMAILRRRQAEAPHRRPGKGSNPKAAARTQARFTRDHMFVTTQNTPLDGKGVLYLAFMRCCARAGIETRTLDAEGREVEHVDVHSLRRTFATNAIVNGADPKSVQEILGHKTLEMTMQIYARVKAMSKRQTVARLSYGKGAQAPGHVIELPRAAEA
jgi:integrase